MKQLLPPLLVILFLVAPSARGASCTVGTSSLNFGFYDALSPAPLTGQGTLSITCRSPIQQPTPVTIKISAGGSGTPWQRSMRPTAGGSNLLLYNIYLDPAASLVLGDGSSGTIAPVTAVTRDTPWNMTIFGRIPAGQDVSTGSYSDLLTVTIEW